ncbi:MAG: hydroxymethylglutaryl-CoA reductase, partial [Eudoraea sp.]|nr:hydroxymethylglutaryl-CoA reductase [Eudoraea sp.]
MPSPIEGFSKLSKEEKIRWIADHYTHDPQVSISLIKSYWNTDADLQQLHDEFIENTLTNFYLPLGIAPNFLINGKLYAIPMAIEESSVVAAASKAAKFWLSRGGFTTKILGTEKIGQVHFIYRGDPSRLKAFIEHIQPLFLKETESITKNMVARGGGIKKVELRDKSTDLKGYYQLHCTFETLDAMGANFINSCLEQFAKTLQREASTSSILQPEERHPEVVMSILSNYVPQCLVRAEVSCPVEDLGSIGGISAHEFAQKMMRAISIANIEPFRAVTHNKG